MKGAGRKPLRCPCCTAGGGRAIAQDPTDIRPDGRVKPKILVRGGRRVQRWVTWVQCYRCGWSWWSSNPTALEQAMKQHGGGRRAGIEKRGLTRSRAGIILGT